MHGNFDAIKRRQNLRKEKTISRSKTLENRKNNLISKPIKSGHKKHTKAEVEKAIKIINQKNKINKKKNLFAMLLYTAIAIIITSIIYFYFSSNYSIY